VAAARCSSSGAVHLDLTELSICTIIGTEIRSSVDSICLAGVESRMGIPRDGALGRFF
jgi:hypothetical protein